MALLNVAHTPIRSLRPEAPATADVASSGETSASVRRLRRFARTRVHLPVKVSVEGAEAEAIIDNVSEVGIGLVTGLSLRQHDPLRLRLPDGEMLEGLVRWAGEDRCGVEIVNATYVPGLGWRSTAPQSWMARLSAAIRLLVRKADPIIAVTPQATPVQGEEHEAKKRALPHGLSPALLERAYRQEGAAVLLPFPSTASGSGTPRSSRRPMRAEPPGTNRQGPDATHELRASVTLLKALVENALEKPSPSGAASPQAQETVTRGFGDLLDLIDRAFQDSSNASLRAQRGRTHFAPRVLVQDIAAAAAAQAKGAMSVRADVDEGVPSLVLGDVIAIRQVLVALVTNALKFTDRGSVTLSLKPRPSLPGEPAALCFEVADTGRGIATDRLSRIFERGHCYGSSKGKGLGLAIAQELATGLGGNLTVRSTVGVGSTFRLDLPLEAIPDQPATAERFVAARPPDIRSRESKRILVVDDVPLMRSIPRLLLEKCGQQVDEAVDGKDALALLARHRYDLVLLDSEMPGMSGVDLARYMQARRGPAGAPRIVVQTAGAIDATERRYDGLDIFGVIQKPLDEAKIAAVLARLPADQPVTP